MAKLSQLYTSQIKGRHQGSTNIWQFAKPPQGHKQWYQKYAATNDPNERLLKNWRGQGY